MKTYEKVYGVKRMCVSHLGAIQILSIPFFQAQDAVGSRLCCHRLRSGGQIRAGTRSGLLHSVAP